MSTTPTNPVWVAFEPDGSETRVLLSVSGHGVTLKGRLPVWPAQPSAIVLLLEALSQWYGRPLHAVIDADAEDVRQFPQRWARALGEPPAHVHVEWLAVPPRRRDDFLAPVGNFSSAQRLLSYAATGRR
jgi:hypothetical protein